MQPRPSGPCLPGTAQRIARAIQRRRVERFRRNRQPTCPAPKLCSSLGEARRLRIGSGCSGALTSPSFSTKGDAHRQRIAGNRRLRPSRVAGPFRGRQSIAECDRAHRCVSARGFSGLDYHPTVIGLAPQKLDPTAALSRVPSVCADRTTESLIALSRYVFTAALIAFIHTILHCMNYSVV